MTRRPPEAEERLRPLRRPAAAGGHDDPSGRPTTAEATPVDRPTPARGPRADGSASTGGRAGAPAGGVPATDEPATDGDPADDPTASDDGTDGPAEERVARPLYPRLLRLRHIEPNGWQRAVLGEGALALAAVLVLADLATAWTLLVLPVGVAVVVKAHDLLAGALAQRPPADPATGTDRAAAPGPGPTAVTGRATGTDSAVLARARAEGVDLGLPRHVQHFLHAPDEQVARAAANVAAGRGFRTTVEPPDDDEATWTVVCETTAALDPQVLERDQALFDQLVDAYGVEYDGWEAEV